jgi:hypothetical protein
MKMKNPTWMIGERLGTLMISEFNIDPDSLCDISIRKEWSVYENKEILTDDELLKVIAGKDRCSSISNDDHPDFKQLRNTLEEQGFIKCQRSWWNGDYVLKSFTLNGAKFNKNEQFPCGAAIRYTVESKQRMKSGKQ